jgi:serine/threonine protein kinase
MGDIFSFDEDELSVKLKQQLEISNKKNQIKNPELVIDNDDIDDTNIDEYYDASNIKHFKKFRSNSVISVGHIDNRLGQSYEVKFDEVYEAEQEESRQNSNILTTNEKSPIEKINKIDEKNKPIVADFQPIKVLGRGSFGKVILVKHKKTGKLYAQKQLKKVTMIVNTKNYERTLTERTILEKVSHPNIVKLYYALQDFDKVYLFLEYLEGGELFFHLTQERIMSEKVACFYVAEMILALRHLHNNAGVIYRDLKPENCLLNRYGHLVLTDFGLSKVSDQCNSMDGTAQYIAPEVIKGEIYDSRCDWWSLGAVMFDMLTGQPPFTGNNNKRIMDKIVTQKIRYPFYLSQISKDLLNKLLNKNVEKRLNIDDDEVFKKVKQHQFFRYINWEYLQKQDDELQPPPIIPIVSNPEMAENFDDEFTSLNITPPNSPISKFIYDNIEESRSNSTSSIIKIQKPDNNGDLQESVYFTDFSYQRQKWIQ